MATVKEFITEWVRDGQEKQFKKSGNWISTPTHLGMESSGGSQFELLGIRLPNGQAVFDSSTLRVATGEPKAWGNLRYDTYQGANRETKSQIAARQAGALPMPFRAFRESGIPMPERIDDPIPEQLKILEWSGPENVALSHVHEKDERCHQKRRNVKAGTKCEWTQHYTGATLVKYGKDNPLEVKSAEGTAAIRFLFDVDRGELCKGRFNAFVAQMTPTCTANTIEEAYSDMCPPHVKAKIAAGEDVKRQGEWFFAPAKGFKMASPPKEAMEIAKLCPQPIGYGIPLTLLSSGEARNRWHPNWMHTGRMLVSSVVGTNQLAQAITEKEMEDLSSWSTEIRELWESGESHTRSGRSTMRRWNRINQVHAALNDVTSQAFKKNCDQVYKLLQKDLLTKAYKALQDSGGEHLFSAMEAYIQDYMTWRKAFDTIEGYEVPQLAIAVEGSRNHTITQGRFTSDLVEEGYNIPDSDKWIAVARGAVSAPDHEDLILSDWHWISSNGGELGVARSFRFDGGID